MAKKKEEKGKVIDNESLQKLVDILNDNPHSVALNNTQWQIHYLKNGTQWLICNEAIKIIKAENASMGDIMRDFCTSIPSVFRVLTLALLNDKSLIFQDGDESKGYSDTFDKTFEYLMWNVKNGEITTLLFEILSMLDVNFFMKSSEIVKMMSTMMTTMKQQG